MIQAGSTVQAVSTSASSQYGVVPEDSKISHYQQKVVEVLTFEDAPQLLRAVPLTLVMRKFGSIWRSSSGSALTYELSQPVETIRSFISHNWAVGRWKKFIALALHFNFNIAAMAMYVVSCLLALLTLLKVLPCIDDHYLGDPAPTGFLVRSSCSIVFLGTLFFARDIMGWLGMPGPSVFLDKVCIHQTDLAVQRQGILKLGGYIHHSDQLVVLFTSLYLSKLWTVYEMAAFMLQHSVSSIQVIPVNLSVVYCLGLLAFAVAPLLILICRASDFPDIYGAWFAGIPTSIWLVALRSWRKEQYLIEDKLKAFSVRNAHCAVPADRPVVCGNIIAMMKAFNRVTIDATDNEALDKFDELARTELSQVFKAKFGTCSFTYGQVVVGCFVSSMGQSLDFFSGLSRADEHSAIGLLTGGANNAIWSFTIYPLFWWVNERCLSRNLHLTGWKNAAYLFCIILALELLSIVWLACFRAVRAKAHDNNDRRLTAILLALAFLSMTIGNFLLRPMFGKPRIEKQEKLAGWQEVMAKTLTQTGTTDRTQSTVDGENPENSCNDASIEDETHFTI